MEKLDEMLFKTDAGYYLRVQCTEWPTTFDYTFYDMNFEDVDGGLIGVDIRMMPLGIAKIILSDWLGDYGSRITELDVEAYRDRLP